MNRKEIAEVIKEVVDPEVGIDIVDLGLIYGIELKDEKSLHITMTMTTMGCPLHQFIQDEVSHKLKDKFSELEDISVELIWSPLWNAEMMSASAREFLGW